MECPRCDSAIRWDVSYCPECGLNIEKLRELLEQWQCPRCDSSLTTGEKQCGECGLAIGTLRQRVLQQSPGTESQNQAGQGSVGSEAKQRPPGSAPQQNPQSGQQQPPQNRQQPQAGRGQPQQNQHQPQQNQQQSPRDHQPAGDTATQPGRQAEGQHAEQPPAQHSDQDKAPENAIPGREPAGEPNTQPGGQHASGNPQQPQQTGPAGTAQQSQAARRSGPGLLSSLPLYSGAIVGVIAYGLNLIAFLVMALFEFSDSSQFTLSSISELEFSGWLLYNAHTIDIELVDGLQQRSFNYLEQMYSGQAVAQGTLTVPKLAYYLVPLVVLFAGSVVLARQYRSGQESSSTMGGMLAGGTVAVGYATAAALGAMTIFSVTEGSGSAMQTAQPPLMDTVLIMGIGFPLAIGAVAGFVVMR